MTKKTFIIILGLSVVVTYTIALMDYVLNISQGKIGLPLGFSRFNFFGSETDYPSLTLDLVFWFVVIWLVWKFLLKVFNK